MSSGDDQHLNLGASTAVQDSGSEDKLKEDSQPNGVEATLDGLEDALAPAIRPVLAATELYETNSDAIHQATKALAGLGDAASHINDWIGIVDKVVDGLDELSKSTAFPFVGAAVFLFKGVVKLETQRRQNSGRSRALILQMADMMGVLLQLSSVQDPEQKDQSTGQTVVGRVQALMVSIEMDIRNGGNLIDTYAKHSLPSKFFFSGQYADKFKACAERLVNRKGDIVFALQIHNTVGIDAIQKGMRENNAMLVKLVSIVDRHSERNEDLNRMMRDLGGRDKVLGDDELLTTMASAVQSRKSNQGGRTKSAMEDGAKFSGEEAAVLSAAERHDLRLPLDHVLEQNAGVYAKKLDAQILRISSQIEHLESSNDTILKTLTGGVWERIVHPDLQHIWKENGWRSIVKAHSFVMAIHDFYDDLLAGRGSPADGIAGQQPFENSETKGHDVRAEDPRWRPVTLADKWCLQYLTVRYSGPLVDFFDVDASGFVRIAEANAFCETIPKGLNLLQWLAYWAEGWKQEVAIYSHKIIGLLKRMRSMVGDVLLHNNRIVQQYFQGSKWVTELKALLYAAASKFQTSTATPLDRLVRSEMQRKEATREQILNKLFYHIDDSGSFNLLSESPVVEADLLPIVYQILKHHYGLIYFSRVKILDDREFTCGTLSLTQLLKLVNLRVKALESTWKMLGVDSHSQFSRYAGGILEFVHDAHADGDADDVFDEEFHEDIDLDLQAIPSDIASFKFRFGEWRVDTSGYETGTPQEALENKCLDADAPLTPIDYTPSVEFSVGAEEFVRRVIIRLEGLIADERFHFIKPTLQIFHQIALGERDRRQVQLTRRLILEVADMLSAVLKVRVIEDVTLVTDAGESIHTRLQNLMLKVERDVKDCGHLINLYHTRGAGRESSMRKKFQDRGEGLERRKQDIINALALPYMRGKALFRAAVRTVVAQIKDTHWRNSWSYIRQRRDNRKTYVRLVAKQLELAEIKAIWNVKVSLTPDEMQQLHTVTSELSQGDWEYYQSLARMQHRSAWVHADRKCDSCYKMPIYGARYLCTVCNNFDMCSECEQKWEKEDSNLPNCGHHAGHPIVKIALPVIEVDKYVFDGLKRIHAQLVAGDDSESSSGSSLGSGDDEDSDAEEDVDGVRGKMGDDTPRAGDAPQNSPFYKPWSFSEVEALPRNNVPWGELPRGIEVETPTEIDNPQWRSAAASDVGGHEHGATVSHSQEPPRGSSAAKISGPSASNDSPKPVAKYRCFRCKRYKIGVRFVMTQQHRGKQLCPSCEAFLSRKYEGGTLPDHLRLLLKCTIPPIAARPSTTPSVAIAPAAVNGRQERTTDEERIEMLESQVRELGSTLSRFIVAQEKHQG